MSKGIKKHNSKKGTNRRYHKNYLYTYNSKKQAPISMNDLHYPIGKYKPEPFSIPQKELWLLDILSLPQTLAETVLNLNETQ